MSLEQYLDRPVVRKFVRQIPEGQYLFQQGQNANTMFFIIGGVVALIAEENEQDTVQGMLGAGEYLGEKALLSETPYQRRYSAQARTETTVLEISAANLKELQAMCPEMIPDLFKGILAVTAKRLDRMNYLVRSLRPIDRLERFISVLIFYCRTAGKQVGSCLEVEVSPENILYYIEMDRSEVEGYFNELVQANALVRKTGHRFLVPRESALVEFLRSAGSRAAA